MVARFSWIRTNGIKFRHLVDACHMFRRANLDLIRRNRKKRVRTVLRKSVKNTVRNGMEMVRVYQGHRRVSDHEKVVYILVFIFFFLIGTGERYDFVITADQPIGAYWIQLRGLGECGIRRVQQLAIIRYARGPYQPASTAPTYDVGIPQGVVSVNQMFVLFAQRSTVNILLTI